MAARNMSTFTLNPRGVCDALDGGQVPPGALQVLTNLIFDPSNPFTFECRPAAVEKSDFTGFTDPDFVSVAFTVGNITYGMIKSEDVSGYDSPFAYDHTSDTLLTVSGTQSSATLPESQTSEGDWTPPTMDLVGVNLFVTHPGFPGGGGAFFGWFDITDPENPVWHAGNTTTTALPAVPTAVAQFNNRAWFAVANAVWYTDALSLTITAGTQVLIVGDSDDITGLVGLPQSTAVQGIIQSLVVFKPSVFALITGDNAFGNLVLNLSQQSVGTSAPRAARATSKGIRFMANDGIRVIGFDGNASDPNADLKIPFVYALNPTRASAAYNNNIYRITVTNGKANGTPRQEYWFDERNNAWSGPHTMTQDMATPLDNSFVIFNSTLAPSLFVSDVVQSGTSIYTENDEAMSWVLQTAPMQDVDTLYENSCCLSTIDMQLPTNGDTYTFVASDVSDGVLSLAQITAPRVGYLWSSGSSYTWGGGLWTAVQYGMETYNIPWTEPLVFGRLVIQASGPSSYGFKISQLRVGYQPLRYTKLVR